MEKKDNIYKLSEDAPQYRISSTFSHIENARAKYIAYLETPEAKKPIKEIADFDESSGETPTPEEAAKILATSKEFIAIVRKMETVSTLLFYLYGKEEAERQYPGLCLDYYNTTPNPKRFYTANMQQFEKDLDKQAQELRILWKEKRGTYSNKNMPGTYFLPTETVAREIFKNDQPDANERGERTWDLYGVKFSTLIMLPDKVLSENTTITTDKLTPIDNYIWLAIEACRNHGMTEIPIGTIYRIFGKSGTPQEEQSCKILDSLMKMWWTKVFVNNEEEAARCKGYKPIAKGFSLLDFSIDIKMADNGKLITTIKISKEPSDLVKYIQEKGQYTTIPIGYLALPVSMTDSNFGLAAYLQTNIVRMKSHSGDGRNLGIEGLYKAYGAKDKNDYREARKKIAQLLDFYVEADKKLAKESIGERKAVMTGWNWLEGKKGVEICIDYHAQQSKYNKLPRTARGGKSLNFSHPDTEFFTPRH